MLLPAKLCRRSSSTVRLVSGFLAKFLIDEEPYGETIEIGFFESAKAPTFALAAESGGVLPTAFSLSIDWAGVCLVPFVTGGFL